MSSTNLLLTSYIATTAENPLHLLQATSAPCFRNAKSFRTLLERNQKGVQRSAFSSRKADSLSACSSSLARQRLVTSTLPNQKIPGLSCSLMKWKTPVQHALRRNRSGPKPSTTGWWLAMAERRAHRRQIGRAHV